MKAAASALLFLYRDVLGIVLEAPPGVIRPRKPKRRPTVLTRREVPRYWPRSGALLT